jgi:hypothetical protein
MTAVVRCYSWRGCPLHALVIKARIAGLWFNRTLVQAITVRRATHSLRFAVSNVISGGGGRGYRIGIEHSTLASAGSAL